MKHTFLMVIFKGLCLGICLCCFSGLLGALEVEFYGGINFLTFDPDKETAYINPISDENEFKPYSFTFASLAVKNEISENTGVDIYFIRDNILHNNVEALFITKNEYFNFQAGPFVGMTDEIDDIHFGFLSSLEITYPGVVFVKFNGSTTMGSDFDFTSEHVRETLGASLGVWLPSAIPSVSASYKSFKKVDDLLAIKDTLARYQVSVEFFAKKMPVTVRLDTGYQTLTRLYDNEIEEYTDEINSLFAGFELKWQMSKNLRIIFGAETPLYSDAKKPMTSPGDFMMSKFTAGIVFSGK